MNEASSVSSRSSGDASDVITAKMTMIATSITTVTPSTVRVKTPRACTSRMTAMVDGGDSARSTAAPSSAVAKRAASGRSAVKDTNPVST